MNEPGLGAGIDPGMALTPLPSSIFNRIALFNSNYQTKCCLLKVPFKSIFTAPQQ